MAFYRTLTLLHTDVPSDQTNFPVGFIGTYTYLKTVANGGKVQNASGFDIYFTSDIAGNNLLNFERVTWDGATGIVEFWIQVPTLSSSVDTVIYLWYGNNAISTDQQNKTGTWDANYAGVYHFGDSTLSVADSTSNANNGTNHGGTSSGDTTISQGSLALDSGSSQYVDVGTGSSLNVQQNLTIEYWLFDKSSGGVTGFICSNLSNTPTNGYASLCHQGIDCYLALLNAGSETDVQGVGFSGTWHFFTGTYDNANAKFYTDAALNHTTSAASASGTSPNNTFIGRDPRTGGVNYLKAWVDELRISNIARSADYISTVKNNISDYTNFITVGSETAGATPINESVSDTLTLSDSDIETLGLNVVISGDAFSLTDALIFTLGVPGIGITDSFTFGDSQVYSENFFIPFFDTLTLADSDPFSPPLNMVAFDDSITLSDSISTLVIVSVGIIDTLTLSDTIRAVANVLVRESDAFTLGDIFQFSIPFFAQINDNFIWRDAQIVAWSSVLPPFADSLTLSDSVVVANLPFWTVLSESLSDTFTFSDGLLFNASINIPNGDTLGLSDNVTVNNSFNPFNQSLSDSFLFSDGILLIVQGDLIQLADSLMLSDSVLIQNATNFDDYIRRYLNDAVV